MDEFPQSANVGFLEKNHRGEQTTPSTIHCRGEGREHRRTGDGVGVVVLVLCCWLSGVGVGFVVLVMWCWCWCCGAGVVVLVLCC